MFESYFWGSNIFLFYAVWNYRKWQLGNGIGKNAY